MQGDAKDWNNIAVVTAITYFINFFRKKQKSSGSRKRTEGLDNAGENRHRSTMHYQLLQLIIIVQEG